MDILALYIVIIINVRISCRKTKQDNVKNSQQAKQVQISRFLIQENSKSKHFTAQSPKTSQGRVSPLYKVQPPSTKTATCKVSTSSLTVMKMEAVILIDALN